MKEFELHEPQSVEEATSMRSSLGESSAFYAGGTELLLALNSGLLDIDHFINVKGIPEFTSVTVSDDGSLIIGAAATHSLLEASPIVREHFPLIADVESQVDTFFSFDRSFGFLPNSSISTTIKSIATITSKHVPRKTIIFTGTLRMNKYGFNHNSTA